jgi:hypothetical protein
MRQFCTLRGRTHNNLSFFDVNKTNAEWEHRVYPCDCSLACFFSETTQQNLVEFGIGGIYEMLSIYKIIRLNIIH